MSLFYVYALFSLIIVEEAIKYQSNVETTKINFKTKAFTVSQAKTLLALSELQNLIRKTNEITKE